MIPEEMLQKIKRVHIKGRRTVNTLMAGQYRSVFRGSGIEFEEVREYTPGDDVKAIDWKVSARLGRPFVKRYREERESIVMLLVDMSGSQRFGSANERKLDKAAELASVLAFSAVKNNDKVGALFFTDRVVRYIPPKKGAGHIWRVIRALFTVTPEGRGTDVRTALDYLSTVCVKKSLAFVISDFMAPDLDRGLQAARHRHELVAAIVSDPGEWMLPDRGIVTLSGLESDGLRQVDAADPRARAHVKAWKDRQTAAVEQQLKRAGVDHFHMSTDQDTADVLNRFFHRREKRMR